MTAKERRIALRYENIKVVQKFKEWNVQEYNEFLVGADLDIKRYKKEIEELEKEGNTDEVDTLSPNALYPVLYPHKCAYDNNGYCQDCGGHRVKE